MERKPDTENVFYIDEYPHLQERIRVKIVGQMALELGEPGQLILFPDSEGEPDGAA